MKKLRVYEYAGCSTCKKALKFLDQKKVPYEKVAIVDEPPTTAEIKKMLGFVGGDLRKLFNTSGQLYREMGISAKLPGMKPEDAITLLSRHGKLVKRPFALADDRGLVGFEEEEWKKTFC